MDELSVSEIARARAFFWRENVEVLSLKGGVPTFSEMRRLLHGREFMLDCVTGDCGMHPCDSNLLLMRSLVEWIRGLNLPEGYDG